VPPIAVIEVQRQTARLRLIDLDQAALNQPPHECFSCEDPTICRRQLELPAEEIIDAGRTIKFICDCPMGALRPDLKCARDAGALIDQVSILNRVWIYVSHALDVIAMARYESAARGIKRLTEFSYC
jgi:hypothetical protein